MVKLCQEEEGWPCVTYHGGKTQEQRAGALERFSTDPGVRILIASLKAGGIGLNLTAASRVIILEPWFNDTVDHQGMKCYFGLTMANLADTGQHILESTELARTAKHGWCASSWRIRWTKS